MERISVAIEILHAASEGADAFLEACLMGLVILYEYILGFLREHLDFLVREVFGDYLPHLGFDGVDLVISDKMDFRPTIFLLPELVELTIKSTWQGMVHDKYFVGVQGSYGILKHETKGTEITPPAVGVVEADKLNLVEEHRPVIQFFEFIVHQGGQDVELLSGLGIGDGFAPFA